MILEAGFWMLDIGCSMRVEIWSLVPIAIGIGVLDPAYSGAGQRGRILDGLSFIFYILNFAFYIYSASLTF